jgi:hypothetical protein
VGPRAGLDDVEKRKLLTLLGLEFRPHGCPVRSQSVYRLCYPESAKIAVYSEERTKHTLCGQNVQFLVLKQAILCNNYYAING